MSDADRRWLEAVVARGTRNVGDGGGPFAAVVVRGDDAARAGFDDRAFYEMFDRPRDSWELPVAQHRVGAAAEPFDAWRAHADRVDY